MLHWWYWYTMQRFICLIHLHLSAFSLLCKHDYRRRFLFEDHPPEVVRCVWKGALGCQEHLFLVITLHKEDHMVCAQTHN